MVDLVPSGIPNLLYLKNFKHIKLNFHELIQRLRSLELLARRKMAILAREGVLLKNTIVMKNRTQNNYQLQKLQNDITEVRA